MTETPEWFQLQDEPEQEPKKPKRLTLKIALFTLPLLLVGAVMVFGENGAEGEDQPNLPTLAPTSQNLNTASANTVSENTKSNKTIANTSKSSVSKKVKSKKKSVVAGNANENTSKSVVNTTTSNLSQTGKGIKNPGLPSGNESDHGGKHKRPFGQDDQHEAGEHQIIGGGEDD